MTDLKLAGNFMNYIISILIELYSSPKHRLGFPVFQVTCVYV